MKTTTYSTSAFIVGSTFLVVILVTQVCLMIMGFLIMLGLHPFITIGLFLLSIYFCLKAVTGDVLYTIDQDGITKDVTPFLFKKFWSKKAFQFYSWEQIKDFKTGTDMSRSYEEFDFITINTTNGKKIEINTKKGDRNSFKEFENTFRQYVEDASLGNLVDGGRPITQRMIEDEKIQMDIPRIQHEIKEKRSFYDTPFAKFLTLFFGLLTIGLVVMMISIGSSRISNIYRILFVMIPGIAYMSWRSFLKDKKN